MDEFMQIALQQALLSRSENGVPIGSALVIDGKLISKGHNCRLQKQPNGSAILHGEMDCLENAGRLKAKEYARATLYTTLSPCDMCSGAILLYKIPRVVIGENKTYRGPEGYLRRRGVKLKVLNDAQCIGVLREFIKQHPDIWYEDIGV